MATEPMGCDIISVTFPALTSLEHSLKQGTFPLWSSQLCCGFPLHAWGEGSFCHPFSLVLALLFSAPQVLNLTVLLSFATAGFLMMLYVRHIGLSRQAAFLSACAFAFSGYAIQELEHTDHLLTLCWIGLVFYGWDKYLSSGLRRWIVLAGTAWALEILGGYPAIPYYTFFAVAAYVAYGWKSERRYKAHRKAFDWMINAAIFVGVGVSLSAVQWVPTLELVPFSLRSGGLSYEKGLVPTYPWSNLVNWVAPDFLGDAWREVKGFDRGMEAWENVSYIGLAPLFLAIFELVQGIRRPGRSRFFSVLFLVCLALALETPLYRVLWWCLPGLRFFRGTSRFLLFAVFSAAVLAGMGLDRLMTHFPRKKARTIAVAFIALTLIDLWWYGRDHYFTVSIEEWLRPPQVAQIIRDPRVRVGSFDTMDLLSSMHRQTISMGLHSPEDQARPYYVFKEFLGAGAELVWNLHGAWNNWSALCLKRLKLLNDASFLAVVNKQVTLLPSVANVLRVQSIEFLIAPWTITGPDCQFIQRLDPVPGGPTLFVHRLKNPLPRAFVVGETLTASDPGLLLKQMTSDQFDPARTVILEKTVPAGDPEARGSQVSWKKDDAREVDLDVDMKGAGYLVLADTYYPGWQARVDGQETEILRANSNFRAVSLPRGLHQVNFSYRPWSMKIALGLTLTSLLTLSCWALTL